MAKQDSESNDEGFNLQITRSVVTTAITAVLAFVLTTLWSHNGSIQRLLTSDSGKGELKEAIKENLDTIKELMSKVEDLRVHVASLEGRLSRVRSESEDHKKRAVALAKRLEDLRRALHMARPVSGAGVHPDEVVEPPAIPR